MSDISIHVGFWTDLGLFCLIKIEWPALTGW